MNIDMEMLKLQEVIIEISNLTLNWVKIFPFLLRFIFDI